MTDKNPITWYAANAGNHQGLVIEYGTGRNVAVTFEKRDAAIIAKAPELMQELKDLIAALDPDKLQAMAAKTGYTVELFMMCRRSALNLIHEIENETESAE